MKWLLQLVHFLDINTFNDPAKVAEFRKKLREKLSPGELQSLKNNDTDTILDFGRYLPADYKLYENNLVAKLMLLSKNYLKYPDRIHGNVDHTILQMFTVAIMKKIAAIEEEKRKRSEKLAEFLRFVNRIPLESPKNFDALQRKYEEINIHLRECFPKTGNVSEDEILDLTHLLPDHLELYSDDLQEKLLYLENFYKNQRSSRLGITQRDKKILNQLITAEKIKTIECFISEMDKAAKDFNYVVLIKLLKKFGEFYNRHKPDMPISGYITVFCNKQKISLKNIIGIVVPVQDQLFNIASELGLKDDMEFINAVKKGLEPLENMTIGDLRKQPELTQPREKIEQIGRIQYSSVLPCGGNEGRVQKSIDNMIPICEKYINSLAANISHFLQAGEVPEELRHDEHAIHQAQVNIANEVVKNLNKRDPEEVYPNDRNLAVAIKKYIIISSTRENLTKENRSPHENLAMSFKVLRDGFVTLKTTPDNFFIQFCKLVMRKIPMLKSLVEPYDVQVKKREFNYFKEVTKKRRHVKPAASNFASFHHGNVRGKGR